MRGLAPDFGFVIPVLRGVVVVAAPGVVRGLVGVLGEVPPTGFEAGDFGVDVFAPGLVADRVPDAGRVGMPVLDDGVGFTGVVLAELGALRVVAGFFAAVVLVAVALVAAAALTPVVVVVPARLAVVAPCVLGAVVRLTPPTFIAPAVLAPSLVDGLAPAVVPDDGRDELPVLTVGVAFVAVVLVVLVGAVVPVVFLAVPTPVAPVLRLVLPPLLPLPPEDASNFSLSCFFLSSISFRFWSAASFLSLSFSFLSSSFFLFSSSCCSFSFFALSIFSLMASADAVEVGPFRPLAEAGFEPAAAPAPVLVLAEPVAPVPCFFVPPAVVRAVPVDAPVSEPRKSA